MSELTGVTAAPPPGSATQRSGRMGVVLRRLCLLVVAAALLLTGCRVDVDATLAMRDDGTGTVAVTITADSEIVRAAPSLAADLALDDATAAGWTVDGPAATADGGLRVVLTKPFRSVDEAQEVLAELSGPQGPFQSLALAQRTSFATVRTTLTGTAAVQGGLAAFGDGDLVAALGGSAPYAGAVGDRPLDQVLGISLTVALPGQVTEAGPTAEVAADGSRATYRVPLDGTFVDLGTTARLRDDDALAARSRQRLAFAGLVLWLAVLAGFSAWWWRRRRQAPPRRGGGPGGGDGSLPPDEPRPPQRASRPPEPTPRPPVPARPPRQPIDPGLAPAPPPIDPGLAPPPRPIDPGLAPPPRPIDPGLAPPRRPAPGER